MTARLDQERKRSREGMRRLRAARKASGLETPRANRRTGTCCDCGGDCLAKSKRCRPCAERARTGVVKGPRFPDKFGRLEYRCAKCGDPNTRDRLYCRICAHEGRVAAPVSQATREKQAAAARRRYGNIETRRPEMLARRAAGETATAIARAMGLSQYTVSKHLRECDAAASQRVRS